MEDHMDREELKRLTKEEISRRIREGVKAVIEQVLEEEMTEHLAAGYRERTPSRRGERNGHYTRDLITPAGRIAQLRVPRDREGALLTEVFERYERTRVVGVFPGEGSLVNLAKGHGRLGFPALPGHGPALGRGRETHKNRDLTLINTEALIEKFLRIVPESQERLGSFHTF
jgi:hypothetical protein